MTLENTRNEKIDSIFASQKAYFASEETRNVKFRKKQLKTLLGLGAAIEIDKRQQERLDRRWNDVEKAISENGKVNDRIGDFCDVCKQILSEAALISWASGGHSNGYVPVYAIGPGTEVFQGRIDNIEIAPAMARIAGYQAE